MELPRTIDVFQRGIADKLHVGAQLFVSRNFEPLADLGIGESRIGVPYTCDSISWWLSCSKPITAKIVNKNARNTCELFAPRTIVERQTSSSGGPTDARQAFANLFKK